MCIYLKYHRIPLYSIKIKGNLVENLLDQVLAQINVEEYYLSHTKGEILKRPNGWRNCHCPFPEHIDNKISFGFNIETGAFKCFGCYRQGNIAHFEQMMNGGSWKDALIRLGKKIALEPNTSSKTLEERAEKYHDNLLKNIDESMTWASELGLSEKIIKRHRIGYMPPYKEHMARIIFPIFDENWRLLTIKKYSNKDPLKCKFEPGGKNSLYGIPSTQRQSSNSSDYLCRGKRQMRSGKYYGRFFSICYFLPQEKAL